MKIEFKNTFLFISILLILVGCSTTKSNIGLNANKTPLPLGTSLKEEIKTGAENFNSYLPLLKDKRVGIVTNQTGIIKYESIEMQYVQDPRIKSQAKLIHKEVSIVDFLLGKKINLQKIYAPEHGFRGTADAGEVIKDGKDTQTGLPIISFTETTKAKTRAIRRN